MLTKKHIGAGRQWAAYKSEISFSHSLRFIKLFAAHGSPKSSCHFFLLRSELSCRCRLHFDSPCQLPVVAAGQPGQPGSRGCGFGLYF